MKTLGVVGAGTMGSGIAQLGVLAGMDVYLHDPVPDALSRGAQTLRKHLARGAEKGRWTSDDAANAEARLHEAASLEGLAPAELIVEAAPERLELKRELFGRLSEIAPDAVLATNTSSIPVTQIAGGAARPENVVGLHFFNPAPLMRLVEVIPALQSGEHAVAAATEAGEAMGKRVILASDGPGFLVNRCGRPFYSESLRIVQERLATHEEVDRIMRVNGGFRMGPFELMDLVGIDVGFEVAKSFMELSFGEPRWKPNPLQARMAASGRHGRKTGRGWYDYSGDGAYRADDPPEVAEPELATPGGILHRIRCCIVNEGFFALGEGVGSEEDIDAGVKLGLNWPKGSIELGRELGLDSVRATLDDLWSYYREERYRTAPALRQAG